MAFDGLRFPAQVKKLTIRTSTRPISNHPFLVGGFLFVIFLYKSSPFLFSLLVSASPVLVCTAILLGTLLTYGHPQIPEIDKDKISSSRAIPLQNNTTVFYEEAMVFSNGRQLSLVDNDNDNARRQLSVFNSNQGGLNTWRSREIAFDQQCVEESGHEYKRQEIVITNANHKEILRFEDSNSILISDEEEEEDYEPSDSGSDGAESSSPEPSMADIIPLLDEIHPLIECENSGLLSNRSHSSNESGINSDEETDHKEAEEEDNQTNKEDEEKSAITWTEDDQKNFMDLGSSDLERNQRLESLIARRRARRSMNERNLIDLDGFDLTISTRRQNPFDFPNVSYDDIGLPPLPGSAPSILLPRRNPFDLPYDSSEDKPDLTGDSFQQEFMQISQKEPVFRRHESFNIKSSNFQRASRFRPYFVAESSFMRQSSEVSNSSSSYQRQSSDVSESKVSSAAEIEQVCVEEFIMDHASGHAVYGSQSSRVLDDQYEIRDFDVHMPEFRLGEAEILISTDFNHDEIEHLCVEEIIPNSETDHASDHVEHGSQSSQILDGDSDVLMPEIRLGELETLTATDFNQDEREHIAEISLGSGGNDPNIDSWLFDGRNLAESTENNVEVDLMEEEEYNDVPEEEEINEIGLNFIETNLMLETIEEEYISSSSSLSIVSEEDNFTESLKHDDDKAMVNMYHIKPEVDNNFDVPILDVSSSSHDMDLDNGHFEEPVYDSSPRASKNRLLEEFAESDVEQEVGERVADELSSSNGQADLVFVATELKEEPELVNGDVLLSKEKLISVADEVYSLKDDGLVYPCPSDSQEPPV